MIGDRKIILDLSDNVRSFIEEQQIDLYGELQQEVSDIRVQIEADPEVPSGTRDLVQVLYGTAAVIST